jgi:hypothetical protein
MKSRSIVALVCGLALLAGTWLRPAAAAEPPPLAEHQIKALYLFNFTKYVEWPVAPTNALPFVIGVAEAPAVRTDLLEITRGKKLQGREIVIRAVAAAADIKGCHILFIGGGKRPRLGELLQAARGAAVLTVGEADDFLSLGGMINFTNQENRVRLEIGLDTVQRAQLNMSAKLLAVAGAVRGRPETPRR